MRITIEASALSLTCKPHALARKYPNAYREWTWQFVFPQDHRWVNLKSGEQGRHHLHESLVHKAISSGSQCQTDKASNQPYISPLVCDPPVAVGLRHPDSSRIARIRGRPHDDDLHILNRGGRGVESPADRIAKPR